MPELIRRGWPVERRVIADRSEQGLVLVLILAIFPQAFSGKRALGVVSCVDLALPAFVGPGRGAEADQGQTAHWRHCTVGRHRIDTRDAGALT